jgi:peptide/nickel transport system permease protein
VPARPALLAGLALLTGLTLFVALGPLLHQPPGLTVTEQVRQRNLPPGWSHPLGTDDLGRDLMLRMMLGGRISLAVGLVATAISVGLGTGVGLVAGYFRRLDGWLMRLTDLFLALPLLPLLLVAAMLWREPLALRFGAESGSFLLITGAIGLTGWMQVARIVHAEVLSLREREYLAAARSIGAGPGRLILRHILPNVLPSVLVAATIGVSGAILTESALSFLGLGFPPDYPTWGRLLSEGVEHMETQPLRVLWPGLALTLTVLAATWIGDGLHLALDPRRRALKPRP